MIELESSSFDNAINSDKLTVIDFWSKWCIPCKYISTILKGLVDDYKDVSFYTIDVDKNLELVNKYNIRSVPTIFYFKNGSLLGKTIGVVNKDKLSDEIKNYL